MTQQRLSAVPVWVLLSITLVACATKDMSDNGTAPGHSAGSSGGSGGQGGTGGSSPTGGGGDRGGTGGMVGSGGAGGGGGSLGVGVAPSGGPRPCGCAADQICVAWDAVDYTPSGLSIDCWRAPPSCVADAYTRGVESMCACFNPCRAWLGGVEEGLTCFDRRTNPNAIKAAEDVRCMLRGS